MLKKEMASLRAAWNWAAHTGLVKGAFPSKGLVYPRADEKPPFMTRTEIERKLHNRMTAKERAELWDCLYLTRPELEELLELVKGRAAHPWIYPLFCFVAHTGCRRSEALRVLVSAVDFAQGTVLIREKQRTTRRVWLARAGDLARARLLVPPALQVCPADPGILGVLVEPGQPGLARRRDRRLARRRGGGSPWTCLRSRPWPRRAETCRTAWLDLIRSEADALLTPAALVAVKRYPSADLRDYMKLAVSDPEPNSRLDRSLDSMRINSTIATAHEPHRTHERASGTHPRPRGAVAGVAFAPGRPDAGLGGGRADGRGVGPGARA
jgi:integrase